MELSVIVRVPDLPEKCGEICALEFSFKKIVTSFKRQIQ